MVDRFLPCRHLDRCLHEPSARPCIAFQALSCSLSTISRFSGNPVLLSLSSWPSDVLSRSDSPPESLSISRRQPFCFAVRGGSHALPQRTQYRSHQPWRILFRKTSLCRYRLSSASAMYSSLVMNPVAFGAGPTFTASSTEVNPNWH